MCAIKRTYYLVRGLKVKGKNRVPVRRNNTKRNKCVKQTKTVLIATLNQVVTVP